jgi:rod shape-determining protein MreD
MSSDSLRKLWIVLVYAILAVFLQGSVLHYLWPNLVIPNFILILVVFLGFYDVSPFGAFLAFLAGLISDLCSGVLVGPSAGASALVFAALSALSSRIFVESAISTIAAVFGASILSSICYLFMVYQFSPAVGWSLGQVVFEAIMTSLVSPLMFKFLRSFLIQPTRERNMLSRSSPSRSRTRTRLRTS